MMTWTPGGDIAHEQTDYATSLRIPLLTSPHPQWAYITGIVVGDSIFGAGETPTDDDVRAVGSFLAEYCHCWYSEHYMSRMADAAPYDIDGSANLGYLLKRGDNNWCYTKRSWNQGPLWVPPANEPHTLLDILDRIHTVGTGGPSARWTQWKAEHDNDFARS